MSEILDSLSEGEILERFDRSSPEALLNSIAKELLRLGRANRALAARVAVMEVLQATADRILSAGPGSSTVEYPTSLMIHAANAFDDAVGLYDLEHDEIGLPFRWTGPERHFSLQFFVDRRTAGRFVLRFGRLFADAPIQGLRCFVDGEEAAIALRQVPRGYEAWGLLRERRDQGASVATFVCPAMESPASRGIPDNRLLGVSFQSLSVGPLGAEVKSDGEKLNDAAAQPVDSSASLTAQ